MNEIHSLYIDFRLCRSIAVTLKVHQVTDSLELIISVNFIINETF